MKIKENLLKKLQNMREDDFSKEIIVPLLKKMGFHFADFYGGPFEHGKDIIAYKSDDFSGIEITVCQSKKFKGNLSSNRSQFNEIITQLRLCIEKPVACHDGIRRKPSKVLFITPFSIASRSVEEHFETFSLNNIKIVDGSSLLTLFEKYWPEAFETFEDTATKATKTDANELINIELSRALSINDEIDYQEYYSDLNFFVGNIDSRQVFSSRLSITAPSTLSYNEEEWLQLRSVHTQLLKQIGTGILANTIEEIEEDYQENLNLFSCKENQERLMELKALRDKIDSNKISIRILMKALLVDINTHTIRNLSKNNDNQTESEDLKKISSAIAILLETPVDIEGTASISSTIRKIKTTPFFDSAIENTLGLIDSIANDLLSAFEEEDSLSKTVHPLPRFHAKISLDPLKEIINSKITESAKSIETLNTGGLNTSETRTLLEKINSLLRSVDLLLRSDNQSLLKTELIKDCEFNSTLDISAHSLFDSGCNITVYGEAGAGKSTTLHVYANKLISNKKDDELILFLPINRITSKINNLTEEEKFFVTNTESNFEKLLNGYLVYKGLPANKEFRDAIIDIALSKRKVVFIIDALDEAANHASWIIPALSELPTKVRNAQVITSSRSTVQKVKEIQFLGVTLLPFNENQLQRFIFGYLKDNEGKESLWNDIKNNKLFEIAKNPLLATIICTLHKNGIEVPRNEPEVYKRKIELLCGLYDNYKGIKRTKNDLTLLRDASRTIAYGMHIATSREAIISEIKSHLERGLGGKVKPEKLEEIIHDLHENCNILHYIPESKTYTFGHLRFQEYLASEMLSTKSSIDIASLAANPWWAGALYLYSFGNDLDDLFDRIYERHGNFRHHKKILEVMISAQPANKRLGLKKLLNRHDRLDDPIRLPDMIEDDYSHGDFSRYDWK